MSGARQALVEQARAKVAAGGRNKLLAVLEMHLTMPSLLASSAPCSEKSNQRELHS